MSVHSSGSCYLTFDCGGVTVLLDIISYSCFSSSYPKEQFAHPVMVPVSFFARSQVGIRVILLLHAFPSHERMRLLPRLNFVLHLGVVICQSSYTVPVARAASCACTVTLSLV